MVQTYQGMNKEIVGILRAGGIPHEMYAAQYIEELQAKIEQLEAEVERLRSEPERVLAYVYESLTKEPWDASRGPLTANCLWIEIGKWIDQARAENERLRAQIVETEATAEK